MTKRQRIGPERPNWRKEDQFDSGTTYPEVSTTMMFAEENLSFQRRLKGILERVNEKVQALATEGTRVEIGPKFLRYLSCGRLENTAIDILRASSTVIIESNDWHWLKTILDKEPKMLMGKTLELRLSRANGDFYIETRPMFNRDEWSFNAIALGRWHPWLGKVKTWDEYLRAKTLTVAGPDGGEEVPVALRVRIPENNGLRGHHDEEGILRPDNRWSEFYERMAHSPFRDQIRWNWEDESGSKDLSEGDRPFDGTNHPVTGRDVVSLDFYKHRPREGREDWDDDGWFRVQEEQRALMCQVTSCPTLFARTLRRDIDQGNEVEGRWPGVVRIFEDHLSWLLGVQNSPRALPETPETALDEHLKNASPKDQKQYRSRYPEYGVLAAERKRVLGLRKEQALCDEGVLFS